MLPSAHAITVRPRCRQCGNVLGAYEPIVVKADTGVRETSLTAEPQLFVACDDCYHRDCFASGGTE